MLMILACGQAITDESFNTAPLAIVLDPTEDAVVLASFIAEGQVQDGEDDPTLLVPRWYMDSIEVCPGGSADASGAVSCPIEATSGEWELRLSVLDSEGLGSSSIIHISVE